MTDMPFSQDANYGGMDTSASLESLLSRLTDADPTVRTWAAIGLRKLNDPRAIPALFSALNDSDWDVREDALDALELIIPSDDVPNLLRLASLPSENEGMDPSYIAMYAYRKLRRHWEQAANFIVSALSDPNITIRQQISTNLSDHVDLIGSSSYFHGSEDELPAEVTQRFSEIVFPALIQGITDDSAKVRAACAKALGMNRYFHEMATFSMLAPLLRDTEDCVRKAAIGTLYRHPHSLDDLLPYLHDSQVFTRAAAIRVLPKDLDVAGIDTLLTACQDASVEVRHAALAQVITQSYPNRDLRNADLPGDPRLVTALFRFLNDFDPAMRELAAEKIAGYWQLDLAGRYLDLLVHGDRDARQKALRVLPELRPHRFVGQLREQFEYENTDGRIAILSLVSRLNSVGTRSTKKHVIETSLRDPDPTLRSAAVEAAAQTEGVEMRDVLQPLLDDPDPHVAATARRVVAQIDERLSYPSLSAGLKDPLPETRRKTVRLIKESPDPRRFALLCDALYDGDHSVQSEAFRLAGEIANTRIVHELTRIIQNTDESSRWLVMEFSSHCGAIEAAPAILFSRSGAFEAVPAILFRRSRAIEALGRCGSPEVVPVLLPTLREKSHLIRGEAAKALTTITGQAFGDDIAAWGKWWSFQEHS